MEEDKNYKLDDQTLQTIILKIMPPEYVKDMRGQLAQGKYKDVPREFEQALYDAINTRGMDEEARKVVGKINNMNCNHIHYD